MSILSQPIQDILIRSGQRKIGDITVTVTISENTTDTLTITKQPVQQGASIVDHAYVEPTVLNMSIILNDTTNAGSNFTGGTTSLIPDLSKTYQQMLNLQSSRQPFTIVTKKRVYKNMLMSTLAMTTDKSTENILALNVGFQQVIIVSISTKIVERSQLAQSQNNEATQQAGNKSMLAKSTGTTAQAIVGKFGQ